MGDIAMIKVCRLDDIPKLGSRVLHTAKGPIAVFRDEGDSVFAVDDRCPHKGGPLSQGIVHGATVTCPLHAWKINLNTGEALAPDSGCVHRYEVKLESGEVFIDLTQGG